MTTKQPVDEEVEDRVATGPGTTIGRESYAMPRMPRRALRFVVPAASVGLGVALGGAALAVLQSF